MKIKGYDVFLWFITIVFIAYIFFMPATVPIHWDINMKVDQYGSRYFYLIFAFLPIFTYYGMNFTKKIDPRKQKIEERGKTYNVFRIMLSVFFIVIGFLFESLVFYPQVDVKMILSIIFGFLFILMGNYMPKLPQSYFLGVRTPWTLANEYVWKKTHQVCGYLFVVTGIMVIILGFFNTVLAFIFLIAMVIIDAIFSYVYSYMLYKKRQNID